MNEPTRALARSLLLERRDVVVDRLADPEFDRRCQEIETALKKPEPMPDDAREIRIRLCTVPVYRLMQGDVSCSAVPGWRISGDGWMIEQSELPADFPPIARAACELLRRFGEFTPQQRACANAAIQELI